MQKKSCILALSASAIKKFKKSRVPLDQENYKKARYGVKKVIAKKRNYFEMKHTENIGKSKELWKNIKAFGLPNKVSMATTNAFKDNRVIKYDPKSILDVIQTFFANMAETLLQKLSPLPNKYGLIQQKNFTKI